MDEFTKLKLKEWGFEEFVDRFKEEEIDSVAFLTLTEPQLVAKLFPKLGQQSKFLHLLRQFKEKHNNEKVTTNTLATMTMMMKTATISTVTKNYTNDTLKLSTRNSDKSLTNLISSSKDIHDTMIRNNVVDNQVPQPQVTTTATPFFKFDAPVTKSTLATSGKLSFSASENMQQMQCTSEPRLVIVPKLDKVPQQQLDVKSPFSLFPVTTNTSSMMTTLTKSTTVTTASVNYKDKALKLSTCNADKSSTNLISSSKGIHFNMIRTNVVDNQVPQPQVTATATPFFKFDAPVTKSTLATSGKLSFSTSENMQQMQCISEPRLVIAPKLDKVPQQQLDVKSPFSLFPVTTNTSSMMTLLTKTTTVTTVTDNYKDNALKLSTCNADKSSTNLISSSKDIHDNMIRTNVVDTQVPQPQVTTTASPFFKTYNPGTKNTLETSGKLLFSASEDIQQKQHTSEPQLVIVPDQDKIPQPQLTANSPFASIHSTSYRKMENDDDDDGDDDYIPTHISPSNIILTPVCETEKSGYWNRCYCSFATEKIVFKTVVTPDIRLLSDAAMVAAVNTDSHNTPYLLHLLFHYKITNFGKRVGLLCFFAKKFNRISLANNFQYPLVSAETIGMLNFYRKMQRLGLKHDHKFKFSVSPIGMDLREYTRNTDLALDPVHSVSNNVMDIVRYPLRYGLIPEMYWLDLKMFLKTIIFKNIDYCDLTRPVETDGVNYTFHINFIEGDIEAIVFDYWSRSTVDLIKYDERVPRKELKDLLHYLFRKLCVPSKVVSQYKVDIFLTNFMKFAEFDLNEDIIPTNCLLFLKTKISTVWPEISASDQDLWGALFNELKVQHLLMAHTISAIFKALDRRFEFIKSKAGQVRSVRGEQFSVVSLWSENSDPSLLYVVREGDVTRILSAFFKSHIDVDSRLCIAIDNLYYYHIFLLSRYAILHNIDVTTKILTCAAVHGFLTDRRDPSVHKYCQKSLVVSHASELMRYKMVSCFRRLYIRDSDKFEAEFEITEFDESLYQSLNELIFGRMNSALSTVIDRKGRFSPKRYAKLHPRPVFDGGSSPPPNILCCYAFASSLYAYMYGLTRKESISMQCVELNCNFERSDKDFYDNIIAESKNVIENLSSQKKKCGYRFDSDTDPDSGDEIVDSN